MSDAPENITPQGTSANPSSSNPNQSAGGSSNQGGDSSGGAPSAGATAEADVAQDLRRYEVQEEQEEEESEQEAEKGFERDAIFGVAEGMSGNFRGLTKRLKRYKGKEGRKRLAKAGRRKLKKEAGKLVGLKLFEILVILFPFISFGLLILLLYVYLDNLGFWSTQSMSEWAWAEESSWWETCTDEDILRELNKPEVESRIKEEDLKTMMIDRKTLGLILEEVIDYNNGAFFGDFASTTLTIEGDDEYTYFDYDEYEDTGWFSCDPDDSGAVGYVWGWYGYSTIDDSSSYGIKDGKFVEDEDGAYYRASDGRYVHESIVSWEREETYTVQTNKKVSVTGGTRALDFEISNKWMYQQYPMDWEYVYQFCVYRFLDEHGGSYIRSDVDDIDSYYDSKDDYAVATVTEKEAYELIEAFMPEFNFTKLPSTKNSEGNSANIFEALIKYSGKWGSYLSWKSNFKKGHKYSYNGKTSFTNSEIKSLYNTSNPYGEQLLSGEPQKVVWYWSEIGIQYDSNGNRVDEPIIHKTVLYYPASSLSYVQTITGKYSYGAAQESSSSYTNGYIEPIKIDTTNVDFNRYKISWAGISDDSDYPNAQKMSLSSFVSSVSNIITGKDQEPVSSVFDVSRMDENIYNYGGGRDIEEILIVIEEMPRGKCLASSLEAAYLYDGEDIESSVQRYNYERNQNIDGVAEYGSGGLRKGDRVFEEENATVARARYGITGSTRLEDVSVGLFH